MEHGIVKDWNDMERIWQYVYSKEQLQTFSEEVSASLLMLRDEEGLVFDRLSVILFCTLLSVW